MRGFVHVCCHITYASLHICMLIADGMNLCRLTVEQLASKLREGVREGIVRGEMDCCWQVVFGNVGMARLAVKTMGPGVV